MHQLLFECHPTPNPIQAFLEKLHIGSLVFYYMQLTFIGEPVVGNHYLVRFQDRLAWMFILERGYGYCLISLKGLELQETSCHTAEAARLDEIFEQAFENENMSCVGGLNHYPLHTLTPVDANIVHTYSDARNVLTGIIDSPDSYKMAMSCFIKGLVWVLLHHTAKLKMKSTDKNKLDLNRDFSASNLKATSNKLELEEINHNTNAVNNTQITKHTKVTSVHRPPSVKSIKRQNSWNSIDSLTDSIWSDDGFPSNKKPKQNMKTQNVNKKTEVIVERDDLDDLMDELDNDFGLPVADVITKSTFAPVTQTTRKSTFGNNTIYKPMTNLAGSPDFKCAHSANISLPKKWRELPVEMSQLSRFLSEFPNDWYRHVLGTIDWKAFGISGDKVALEVGQDDTLLKCYSQLIMACYSLFANNGKCFK